MLGIFHDFCRLLIFFKIHFLKKKSPRNTIRVLNSFDPDQDRLVETVYKGYQQTTIEDKGLIQRCVFIQLKNSSKIDVAS